MRYLLDNLEIVLSLAGLVVIAAVTLFFSGLGGDAWQAAAVTATGVGLLHGGIFWVVRRRQREARRAALRDAQAMLRDLINTQLSIIQGVSELYGRRDFDVAVNRINESVASISDVLLTLSEEKLQAWKKRYPYRTD